eukprot:2816430-Prymnesium_polylepis.1
MGDVVVPSQPRPTSICTRPVLLGVGPGMQRVSEHDLASECGSNSRVTETYGSLASVGSLSSVGGYSRASSFSAVEKKGVPRPRAPSARAPRAHGVGLAARTSGCAASPVAASAGLVFFTWPHAPRRRVDAQKVQDRQAVGKGDTFTAVLCEPRPCRQLFRAGGEGRRRAIVWRDQPA